MNALRTAWRALRAFEREARGAVDFSRGMDLRSALIVAYKAAPIPSRERALIDGALGVLLLQHGSAAYVWCSVTWGPDDGKPEVPAVVRAPRSSA